MERLVFNDGDGTSSHYEISESGRYFQHNHGENTTIFDKLGIGQREKWKMAAAVYGESTSGGWPSTNHRDKLEAFALIVKDLWLKKFQKGYVYIDGKQFMYEVTAEAVGDKKETLYDRGSSFTFYIDRKIVSGTVKTQYLELTNHHSNCEKLNSILKEEGSSLSEFCTTAFGYRSTEGTMPQYQSSDMAAASSLINALKVKFSLSGTVGAKSVPADEHSTPAEIPIGVDAKGYPTYRFKKDDLVLVGTPPGDRHFDGWNNGWARGMGLSVGKEYIVGADAAHNGVLLRDPETGNAGWTFPHHLLTLIKSGVGVKKKGVTISTDTLDFDIPISI